jgi:Holin of 3TMs, for gene-transfer release
MAIPLPIVDNLLDLGGKIIDKIWPDKAAQQTERDKAQLALLQLQQAGALQEMATSMSAIIAEAQSNDPWTSRARPTFLYVIYVMILMSIPMGILAAFRPEIPTAIANGMNQWLAAIPSELYTLFGIGYLGYAGSRTWEKVKGKAK